MSRTFAVVLTLVVACDTAATTVDAPHADGASHDGGTATSCANPLPTTAADTLTISGVLDDDTGTGLAGATLAAFHLGGASLGTAVTETTGIYQVAATTGGAPIDYLQIASTGYRGARYFPRAPIAKSTSLAKLPLYTTANAAMLATTAGVTQDPARGLALVTVADCFGSPTANATVTVVPAGTAVVKYVHGDGSTTGTATDSTGVAMVFNLPAGTSTLGAIVGATSYHEHAITADPTYITLVTIAEQ